MSWYQQGDVMIKPVEELPSQATPLPEPILAEGEAAGHSHVALGEDVEVSTHLCNCYLSAPNGARVVHPEHQTIEIPPGNYLIEHVREYDHFADESRRVWD